MSGRKINSNLLPAGAFPLWFALLFGLALLTTSAQVPGLLNFQGRLAVGSIAFDGTGQFKFALANASGSETYWRNAPDGNSDGQPDTAVSLPVTKGLYSLLLGDTGLLNMAALPVDVFTNGAVYLAVWFNDGVNGFQRLTPDQRVAATGYAMIAATVPDGAITAAKLASGPLNAANIPNLDAGKITSGTISSARLPASIATDIATLQAANAALSVQLAALSNLVQTLPVANPANPAISSVAASSQLTDSALLAAGYQVFNTIASPSWQNGATVAAAASRGHHTAVWTGDAMIVWGGFLGGDTFAATGGSYAPALDQWTSVTTFGAPAARQSHSAIWTGTEMVVWGGFGAAGYMNSGGRFLPGGQVWNPVTTTGAPTGRGDHVCVWTGNRMVVWGGRNSGGFLADGALYDPAANQWTSLNLTGTTEAHSGAASVWTGTRLVLWGGDGLNGELNSGARLFINSAGAPQTWQTVATLNAPSARTGHTAVWTGQKMLVWGGQQGGAYFNSGGIYDPATDTWTALATAGAPSPRSKHAAVWTGSEMLIVGGEDASGPLASGGAYDPAANQWRSLTGAGNPVARSGATAVFANGELLMFGGQATGQVMAALQRLTPQPTWYLYRKL